jgi:hypothetical protein
MSMYKKNVLKATISRKEKAVVPLQTLPVMLRGGVPETLHISEDKIVEQLQKLQLVERCRPNQVVAGIEKEYAQHKAIIIEERPEDFDAARVREKIMEDQIRLANEKNGKKRWVIEETINIWSSWYENLSRHQEDAIYIKHPESYVAIWITGGHHFAVRHGPGGTFCVMEVTKEATRTILTHCAYSGPRYRGPGFAVIAKYDRREVVESTTFEKIRKVGNGKWVVVDSNGLGVEVSERWVVNDTNIPFVCYNDAKNRYKCGDMSSVIIPPGSNRCHKTLPIVSHRNNPGEHKCLPACFMSAMHFIGFPEIANRIKEDLSRGPETSDKSVCADVFLTIANRILLQYDMKLVKNNKLNRYDPRAVATQQHNKTMKKRQEGSLLASLRGG